MFVDAAVSSMNTSFLGSSLVCILNHALRAAATSGLSCSAACRLFFKSETKMANKAEDRGLADSHPLLRQASLEFSQRDVRLRTQPSRDPIPVPFQRITFVTTKFLRTDTPGASPTCEKSAYRTDAHVTEFSGLLVGVARLDRMNYVTPQVLRIWLAHSCWPPLSSGQLESQSAIRVNPRFNLSEKCSRRHRFVTGVCSSNASYTFRCHSGARARARRHPCLS